MPRTQAAKKEEKTVAAPASKSAPQRRVTPVRSTRQFVDTSEQQVGQDKVREMRSRGPARTSLQAASVEPVGSVTKDHLEALRFNEEIITVLVHDTTNPHDEPYPEVWNDGIRQMFKRGEEMQVKRKFVEILARAKKTTYTQRKYKDDNGDEAYHQVPHTALKYPFTVVEDSQKGKAWLKTILAEA